MATAPPKKTVQQQTIDAINRTNLVGMNAAVPGLKVGIADLGEFVLGAVDRRNPKVIMLNQYLADPLVNAGMAHTIPHEFEHVLQNQVAARYGNSYDTSVLGEYKKLGGTKEKLVSTLENSAKSTALKSHLESIVGTKVAPYLGKMTDNQYSLVEQFAELSALESYSNKDLTKDPVVRKEFFGNDQALIDVYKASTGFRTTRLDSKDLPPMTAQKTPDAPQQSVLDQIIDAAKKVLK